MARNDDVTREKEHANDLSTAYTLGFQDGCRKLRAALEEIERETRDSDVDIDRDIDERVNRMAREALGMEPLW